MQTKTNYFALVALTALFFVIGFITVLKDILVPHLKDIFELNYFEATLVQFCFFSAYFITGGFFGKLLEKVGYPTGIILGFILTAIGCVLFYPAASMASYPIFLGALFILASGIVLLQTTGNPFVTLLAPGKESTALTLVQAFNSLGTTLGPLFGAAFILSDTTKYANKMEEAQSVQMPYLSIAGALIILAVVMYLLKLPDVREKTEKISDENHDGKASLFQYSHFVLGAIAIFFYVGAEVAIGSFLISTMSNYAGIEGKIGAEYVAFYWGGIMIGRFVGSFIMTKIAPNKCLAFNAIVSICLIILAILFGGKIAMVSLLAIGLFNSIMFPSIFSLATKNLGKFTSQASGFISMAIVGGAIIPQVQSLVADNISLLFSYIIPLICYIYIFFFAFKGYKIK
ncbi:sugar MFS transporter [Campylobacter sp. 2457A]|uniref:sugar MFS transporter n=1 Tax=Campylobacter sp. 2457A TaxID=2735784 RepID=UPI00301E2ED5|nr:sugar MFS transporter [Campylobacter sp. 2457A]